VRAVLDSSVLVAAHISRAGVCAELLEDVLSEHDWLISEFIVDELTRKLIVKFDFPESEVADIRRFIVRSATIVSPAEVPASSCRDPNDLPVLGTAVACQADVLITVDKDLLDLREYSGIAIIRPGTFWRLVDQQKANPPDR
jgi:putative PIN family toxin of toxin-antitoxin system